VATLMHDGIAARPWVAEVITADDLLGEAALWLVEAIELGATPEQAVHLYRQVWYYTAGEILIRVRRACRGNQTHPCLAALGDSWTELTAQDTYVEGLRALIDGALPPVA
jgi:hypothetical protein